MKKLVILAPVALLLTGCVADDMWSEAPGSYRYADSAPVSWWGRDAASVELFYDSLSPYGRWVDYPSYGRVFLPAGVGTGWKPYSRGYWVNDHGGRRWMSQEPFGWATYHYGRWGNDPRLGWFWVPGTQFSAAWVDWRYDDGYDSWAPMAPIGWDRYGYYGNDWWMSAPSAYLWRPGLYNYIRPGRPGYTRPGYDRPGMNRPERPGGPGVNRPDRPDRPGMNRPDRPDRPEARPDRPDRPQRPYPGYRNRTDPPPSNIGQPPRERPQGVRPGTRPEGGMGRPSRPDGTTARPAPQPRQQVERPALPPRERSAPPARAQHREASPKTQDQ